MQRRDIDQEQGEAMYTIQQGLDSKWYAVFANEYEADLAEFAFGECPRACFGQYDNAYRLN